MNGQGCCGEKELVKFAAYKMVEYQFVVHLDIDTLLLKSIDHLIDQNKTLVFTKDYGMCKHLFHLPDWKEKMMIQGGFVILRPNVTDFEAIIDQVIGRKQ